MRPRPRRTGECPPADASAAAHPPAAGHRAAMPRSVLLPIAAALAIARASAATTDLVLDLHHRAWPGGAWTPLGRASGALDGDGLAAVPRRGSPSLALVRSATGAPPGLAAAAADPAGLYSVRVTVVGNDSPPLVASAPAACAAAARGALPLKLDGAAPGRGAPVEVTGVSFDFYSAPCDEGAAAAAGEGWALPATATLALWLPATAPPLLPPPVDPRAAKPPPPPAPKKDAAGESDGGVDAPKPDERTWLQKNFIFVLPAFLLLSNLLQSLAGPPPQRAAGGGRPGGGAAAARG